MNATAAQPATPTGIVRAYLAVSALFTLSASVIWGVNTLFLLDAGLDIFQVFVANAAFTAGMVLFEIPTGVVADTAGRRFSFLLSTVTLMAGTLAYVAIAAAGGGLLAFVIASLVLGLGFSFYSGAVEAWVVDALGATGYAGQLDRVPRAARWSPARRCSPVPSGRCARQRQPRVALHRAGGAAGGGLRRGLACDARHRLHAARDNRPSDPRRDEEGARRERDVRREEPPVRLLMIVAFFQGAFLMWAFYAWQPYFLELLGRDAVWVAGVVSALIALSMIAGNALVEVLTGVCGRRTTLLLRIVGRARRGCNRGWARRPRSGPRSPCSSWRSARQASGRPYKAYLHAVIPSSERATVVSFASLVGSAGGIGGQLGLGYLSRAQSVATAYVAGDDAARAAAARRAAPHAPAR